MIEIIKDPNTLLLLHGEDLTDSSIYGQTITNSGVSVSTAQSKFGGSSLYFNGSSNLRIANILSGSMPFTIDAWIYPTKAGSNTIWSHGGSNASPVTGGVLDYYTDNKFIYYCGGFLIQTANNYPINQWYHVAFIGDGSSIKLYVNGSLVGTHSGAYNFSNVAETFGDNDSAPGQENFQGYIDELRVSNVVRWTENFTPPTSPYITSSITITPGGEIPQRYALRRRMMTETLKLRKITLSGGFAWYEQYHYGAQVYINGAWQTAPGEYYVLDGDTIIMRVGVWATASRGQTYISIDGIKVVTFSENSAKTYEYTVKSNCNIVGEYSTKEMYGNLKLTTE